MTTVQPEPNTREWLVFEAQRLGAMDDIQPLLDIIDWCDRAQAALSALERAMAGGEP